jgi:NADH:ubiquinone oxidoreductase subunit 5 (subunit L)/multisubunit Na+/H+ antiporter MnhA subunit
MFMAAGLVYAALGHDRIDELAGAARALPITIIAFVVGGVALMGVVPSGAYLAKKLLLDSADQSGQWWWTVVLQGGAVFTAGYVVLVLVRVLRRPAAPLVEVAPVSMLSQLAALGLAVASLLLSLAAALGPLPSSLLSNPLSPKDLGTTLAVLLGGVLLAAALARRPLFGRGESAARRATVGLGLAFERGDYLVRRWPSAMLALLLVAAASGFLLVRA